MNTNHNELLKERVTMESAEEIVCKKCYEPVIFHLKDKKHEFSMGLSTVLECLIFAIQQGDLPKLPMSWLADIDDVCHTAYSEDKRNYYYDDNFPRKRE